MRRLLRAGIAITAATPFLVFGISNLYLMSPLGRALVAGTIEQRIGLESSVEGGSWSPWNGITIYGLRIAQPEPLRKAIPAPLLAVDSLRVRPVWSQLIKTRQLLLRGIEIRGPKLTIPIELLSQLPHRAVEPQIAANAPVAPTVREDVEKTVPHAPQPNVAKPPIEVAIAQPPVVAESAPAIETPTLWLSFSDASVKIVSALSRSALYEVSQIDGGLPLSGKSAKSEIFLRNIRLMGSEIAKEVKIPIEWSAPFLHFRKTDGGLLGVECEMAASIGIFAEMPFQIDFLIPAQKNKEFQVSEQQQATIGELAAQGRLQGLALAPTSWQGQWVAKCSAVDAQFSGQEAHFDSGQAMVVFANGALSCVDARLIGDRLSIMGNATILSDGRTAANGRIIAAPEALVAISKYTEPEAAAPMLTPLSTPQRAALDLSVFGTIGDLYYRSNPAAALVPLR